MEGCQHAYSTGDVDCRVSGSERREGSMKGFILKQHEASTLAAGKPVVIWRVCKPQPDDHLVRNEVLWRHPKKLGPYSGDIEKSPAPFPVGVPLFGKETWGLMQ